MSNELVMILATIGIAIFGYLVGSFPSAIFIGKVFYGVDVRKEGSHNAGGTNVGRVIGKKAGFITIGLDVFKTILSIWIPFVIVKFSPLNSYMAYDIPIYYVGGLAAAIGHSFPIFAHFKGGKAMSVYAGFVFATNPVITILGFIIFIAIFFWKKYVSLASILAPLFVIVLSIFLAVFPVLRYTGYLFVPSLQVDQTYYYTISLTILAIYVIIRHIPNIKRLMRGEEPHTHFKKKEERKEEVK